MDALLSFINGIPSNFECFVKFANDVRNVRCSLEICCVLFQSLHQTIAKADAISKFLTQFFNWLSKWLPFVHWHEKRMTVRWFLNMLEQNTSNEHTKIQIKFWNLMFSVPFILRYMIHRWILILFPSLLFSILSFNSVCVLFHSLFLFTFVNWISNIWSWSYFFFILSWFWNIYRCRCTATMDLLLSTKFNSIVWPNVARFLVCACLNRIKQKIYVIFVSLSFVKVLFHFLVIGYCGLMCRLPSSSSSSSFYSFQFHCVFHVHTDLFQ